MWYCLVVILFFSLDEYKMKRKVKFSLTSFSTKPVGGIYFQNVELMKAALTPQRNLEAMFCFIKNNLFVILRKWKYSDKAENIVFLLDITTCSLRKLFCKASRRKTIVYIKC